MTIEETVECFIADFERDRGSEANYFWREAYESALAETEPSKRLKSIAFVEILLFGRRRQVQEFADDLDAHKESQALRRAINRLRSISCKYAKPADLESNTQLQLTQ